MSQENVEIVRRHYEGVARRGGELSRHIGEDPRSAEEAWNAGDIAPEGAALVRYVHPNVE